LADKLTVLMVMGSYWNWRGQSPHTHNW